MVCPHGVSNADHCWVCNPAKHTSQPKAPHIGPFILYAEPQGEMAHESGTFHRPSQGVEAPAVAAPDIEQILMEVEAAIWQATGSALLAGEKCKASDAQVIYRILCEAGNRVAYVREQLVRMPPANASTLEEPK